VIAGLAALVAAIGVGIALAPRHHRGRSLVLAPPPPPGTHRTRPRPLHRRSARGFAAATIVTVGLLLLGPAPVIAVGVGAWSIGRARTVALARHTRRAVDASLADGLELLVLLLQTRLAPSAAARELARHAPEPLRPGWRAVVLRVDRGRTTADAIAVLVDHHGAAVAPVVHGLVAAERYGTPLTPSLERWSDEIRSTRRRAAEAHARTLSVRMSFPLVCCTLPSFVLLALVPTLAGTVSTLRGFG